ncbi:MAG: thiamine phosphate synthase [Pseudomonadota bacterium]|jgi:thiamine-phosphate pyrophosphorylase
MAAILRGLYALTPDGADTDGLLARVEQALAGGVRLVQYRNKEADAAARRSQAGALLALCRRYGARLIVNDDWRLALEIDADGAHLGRADGDPAAARAALGDKLLGISCYAEFERAREAARLGADYVAFGSVFASATKPQAVRAPLELLGRARRELGLPVAAIGGITLENAPLALAAGAGMLAVISDLFAAPDIQARVEAYGRLFRD